MLSISSMISIFFSPLTPPPPTYPRTRIFMLWNTSHSSLCLLPIAGCLAFSPAFHSPSNTWHHCTCSTLMFTSLVSSIYSMTFCFQPKHPTEGVARKDHQQFLHVTFFSLCSLILDIITTFDTIDHFLSPLFMLRGLPDQHHQSWVHVHPLKTVIESGS